MRPIEAGRLLLPLPGGLAARFEQMRIDIGVGENAGHSDMPAADLSGHVAVEILRGHDLDRIGEGRRAEHGERQGRETNELAGHGIGPKLR